MVRNADGSWRSKNYAEQKRDVELRAEQAKTATTRPTKEVDAWQTSCEELRGSANSHGRNQSLQEIYDLAFGGKISWREAHTQMSTLKRSYQAPLQTARY